MVEIYLADFIHAVVAVDEIQERGSLYGNQVYFGPFQLPQAYSFCEEFIFQALRVPKLLTFRYAHMAVLQINQLICPLALPICQSWCPVDLHKPLLTGH